MKFVLYFVVTLLVLTINAEEVYVNRFISNFIRIRYTSINSRTDELIIHKKKKHKLAKFWLMQSVMGLVGTFLNSFHLFIFYKERKSLWTSVNAMLM